MTLGIGQDVKELENDAHGFVFQVVRQILNHTRCPLRLPAAPQGRDKTSLSA